MTIEIQYKTDTAYSFHAFSLKELKSEINNSMKGNVISMSDAILFLETTGSQKEIASMLGVSARYLRYIKTGKRLSGIIEGKKDITLRKKIHSLIAKRGYKTTGGYTTGQLRIADYLDLVCEKNGEIVKDFHGLYYEHGALPVIGLNYDGLYERAVNCIRDAIASHCREGSYCETIIYYSRGNKHLKTKELCEYCGSELVARDNKKLIYTVIMIKPKKV